MTEIEVVLILRHYFESLFPKVCPNCKRCFATLKEYIFKTQPVGLPISHDAEFDDWETLQPVGTVVLANCPCGSTLALSTQKMLLPLRLKLLRWVRIETKQRGVSPSELLDHLRNEVRKQVLNALI